MATTTVEVTPGVGAEILFDSVTGPGSVIGLSQIIKILAGGDGDALGYLGGALVDGTTDEVAVYTRERPDVREYTATLAIDTTAYAAGDQFGELQTITNAAKATGGGLRIDGVTVVDRDGESPEFDILFFNDSIGASTDNSPFDPSDADLLKYRGGVSVLASDWSLFADNAVCNLADVGVTIPTLVGTSLYAVLVIRTADTFTASTDIFIQIAYTRL